MAARVPGLWYLMMLIAMVTFTQAFIPSHREVSEQSSSGAANVLLTKLPGTRTGDPVADILASASFDFSFTASFRDSLRRARLEAAERTIGRFSRPVLQVADRQLAFQVLTALSVGSYTVDPDMVVRRLAPWDPYIVKYSKKYGVDPNLVRAIIFTESSGNQYVISRRGAMGLMQLMPVTVDLMGISQPFNPEQNILAGTKYIAWLTRYFAGDSEAHVLWAWHAGPSMPEKRLLPGSTRDFILKVLSVKRQLDSGGRRSPA